MAYALGTLPFLLTVLYFCGDMSRGASAAGHLPEAALGVALCFIWMKTWHAIFAGRLMALLTEAAPARIGVLRFLKTMAGQSFIQSTALVVLPLSVILLGPFGWVYAFFHNFSVYGAGDDARAAYSKSERFALIWPMQNHAMILILWLFGLFVFADVFASLLLAPFLLHTLLGVETVFTRSPYALLNTTFLGIAVCLTYLCVNPLSLAAYVLRCYHGESVRTGEDLKVELKRAARDRAKQAVVALLLAAILIGGTPARCHGSSAAVGRTDASASSTISPEDLDRTLREVMARREFAWRAPGEEGPSEMVIHEGPIARFLEAVEDLLASWYKKIKRLIGRLLAWIRERLKSEETASGEPHGSVLWMFYTRALLFLLLAAALSVLAVSGLRLYRRRTRDEAEASLQPRAMRVDVSDDSVGAGELPAEEWLEMARALTEKGEFRLAVRALYLATMARLARAELITLSVYKSNAEYQRELRRKAASRVDVPDCFSLMLQTFERVWYGRFAADENLVEDTRQLMERMRIEAGA
ncbi:MAG: DUF4129 domain-containing protein [Acidobacteriota bacterium]